MKRYNYIVGMALAMMGLSLSSCNDVFDELSVNPNQQDVSSFYNNAENINQRCDWYLFLCDNSSCYGGICQPYYG